MEGNLGALAPLSVDSAVDLLRQRWESDLPYTEAQDGSRVVIAVNPLKELKGLRGRKVWSMHDEQSVRHEPHIYGVSAGSIRRIEAGKRDQVIIVIGESGAGKTESSKIILEHLTKRSSKSNASAVTRILASNPLLEAFGNASTAANENSSRFGKLLEVQMDSEGRVNNAQCLTFLLERSRVTSRNENERNFHVFYQLLAGITKDSPKTRFVLGLADCPKPSDFDLLRSSAEENFGRDFLEAARTLRAMSYLGFSQQERMSLMQILAAILHLGNLRFSEGSQGAELDLGSRLSASHASRLLGLGDSLLLESSLCERLVNIRGEAIAMRNTTQQATQFRDALCRELYSRTFEWLVAFVNAASDNETVAPQGSESKVSLLDIMGFEVQTKNSLEQLCINYANEKLQFLFSKQMIYQVQEEYFSEGLVDIAALPPHMLQTADDATLNFFEHPSRGLFSLLEQECFVPGGSDAALVRKLGGASRQVQTGKLLNHLNFVLRHFAGPVEYSADGILEKNTSAIPRAVLAIMERSPLVASFPVASKASISARTTGGKFKSELETLLANLQNANDISWIRCIRPNANKDPCEFDVALVKKQVHASGIIPAVVLARQGFPHHMQIQAFYARYQAILNRVTSLSQIRMGKTKVYLSDEHVNVLDSALHDYTAQRMATKIQARYRAFVQRCRYLKEVEAAKRLQEAEQARQSELIAEAYRETVRIKGILISPSLLNDNTIPRAGDLSSISSVTTMEDDSEEDIVVVSEETSFILASTTKIPKAREVEELQQRLKVIENAFAQLKAERDSQLEQANERVRDQERIAWELQREVERLRDATPLPTTRMRTNAHKFIWRPDPRLWRTANVQQRSLLDYVGALRCRKHYKLIGLGSLSLVPMDTLLKRCTEFSSKSARIEFVHDWVLDQLMQE